MIKCIEDIEEKLPFILWHDVMMTCWVLNHMPNLHKIINNLEEIALKAIVLAETIDKVDWNYFPDDYESLGFRKLDYEWKLLELGQVYHIWVFEK